MRSSTSLSLLGTACLASACTPSPQPPPQLPWYAHQVVAAADHTIVVTGVDPQIETGTIESAGNPIPLPVDPSTNETVPLMLPVATTVAVGAQHACVLSAFQVLCWGEDNKGALGARRACQSASTCVLGPEVMPTLPPIRAIAAGSDVTCAIAMDDRVLCWGDASDGKLGGSVVSALDPPIEVTLTPGKPLLATSISISDSTACAIDHDGSAWCWGVGYGAAPQHLAMLGVTDVAVNSDHGCAIAGGALACWGNNANGQIDATAARACKDPAACTLPVTPIAGSFTHVAVGARHTCALDGSGDVQCWGSNELGQLGGGDAFLVGDPRVVLGRATAITAGTSHSCALDDANGAWCWGRCEPPRDHRRGARGGRRALAVRTRRR